MSRVFVVPSQCLPIVGLLILLGGCEPIPKAVNTPEANNATTAEVNSNSAKTSTPPVDLAKRKQQFAQMQQSMQAVATLPTSRRGPEFDFKFEMPSDDWTKLSHGGGDRKSSVWLFASKQTGAKILLSCAGTKEDPSLASSAQKVFDASVKKQPSGTREWKVGNFTLKRSFIGFIDERHGEVTVTAFSPLCTLEINIGSETMDRDDLFKFSDNAAEELIKKNPTGGFPSK